MPAWDDALPPLPSARSAAVAVLLGWVVPGLGQAYVGRPVKALLFFAVVVGTYALGLYLAGGLCVNPGRDPIWFAAQALAGGPTAAAAWVTRDWVATERIPTYDVGLLYTTIAALLNAVVVSDAIGTVEERARERAAGLARRREIEAERAAQQAALAYWPSMGTRPIAAAPAPERPSEEPAPAPFAGLSTPSAEEPTTPGAPSRGAEDPPREVLP